MIGWAYLEVVAIVTAEQRVGAAASTRNLSEWSITHKPGGCLGAYLNASDRTGPMTSSDPSDETGGFDSDCKEQHAQSRSTDQRIERSGIDRSGLRDSYHSYHGCMCTARASQSFTTQSPPPDASSDPSGPDPPPHAT